MEFLWLGGSLISRRSHQQEYVQFPHHFTQILNIFTGTVLHENLEIGRKYRSSRELTCTRAGTGNRFVCVQFSFLFLSFFFKLDHRDFETKKWLGYMYICLLFCIASDPCELDYIWFKHIRLASEIGLLQIISEINDIIINQNQKQQGKKVCSCIKERAKIHLLKYIVKCMKNWNMYDWFRQLYVCFQVGVGALVMWTLLGRCRSQESLFEPIFLSQGCIFGKNSLDKGIFFFRSP